ncbi:hypothetical protein [Peribacillus sp. SCS-37]|uniref:hypothetical protein n=1 Tax=Paraperibacillus esterisolvens TaxID=3115296 RepID=UPI0039062F59
MVIRGNIAPIYSLDINKSEKLLMYILEELGAGTNEVSITLKKLTQISGMNRLTVNNSLKAVHEKKLISIKVGTGTAANRYKIIYQSNVDIPDN